MLKLITFLFSTFFFSQIQAQSENDYYVLTFINSEFLEAHQQESVHLPTGRPEEDFPERIMFNHHFNFQYFRKLNPIIAVNAGLGLNIQYYSVRSNADLTAVADLLAIRGDLAASETGFELFKLKRTSLYATLPVGIKFFLDGDESSHSRPNFSLTMMTEKRLGSSVNATYVTDRGFLSFSTSQTSSIDQPIQDFYSDKATDFLFSFRIGFGFQIRIDNPDANYYSLDFYYAQYFNSFDAGISTPPRGGGGALRYHF